MKFLSSPFACQQAELLRTEIGVTLNGTYLPTYFSLLLRFLWYGRIFVMNFCNFYLFNHCELWDRSTFDLVFSSSFKYFYHLQNSCTIQAAFNSKTLCPWIHVVRVTFFLAYQKVSSFLPTSGLRRISVSANLLMATIANL